MILIIFCKSVFAYFGSLLSQSFVGIYLNYRHLDINVRIVIFGNTRVG